jgi:hypothetical protein
MSDVWTVVSAISASVSALVVVAAAVYGVMEVSELKKARAVQSLLALYVQYMLPELTDIRRRLLAGELSNATKLSDPDREELVNLLGLLELIAVLVDRGLLDAELVSAMFQSLPDAVDQAKPYIELRRKSQQPDYAALSEKLATKMATSYAQRYGPTT